MPNRRSGRKSKNKKGAVFYIIDAFVAATIITMTLIIILSSHTYPQEPEEAKDALRHYTGFLRDISIGTAPSSTADELINQKIITDTKANILSTVIDLVQDGRVTNASNIITDINKFALPSQYGLNFTVNISGVETEVMSRGISRKDVAGILLRQQHIIVHEIPVKTSYFTNTILPGESTGEVTCTNNNADCIYVSDPLGTPIRYLSECNANHAGWNARCLQINETSTVTATIGVTIWT